MGHMRAYGLPGITVARLKRMQAIRRKLRRIGLNLSQLQDLGGCRAILSTMDDVRALADKFRARARHEIRGEKDYIEEPKVDGYRSHHIMLNFCGNGSAAIHDGRRVEVQLRTRLQHSWATAVEAVGLFRGEDLKGNHGHPGWLRLFQLMSGEFALAEGCYEGDGMPSHGQRLREIKDLDKALDAAKTLENLSHAVRSTEYEIRPDNRPTYYLIKYNHAANMVEVSPYFRAAAAVESYDEAEFDDNKSGNDTANIVLVEADKIENLKEAYPNYFGDVQLFKARLKHITGANATREYKMKPQDKVPVKPHQASTDTAWLRRPRFGKPKGA
jgi:hypothetical protein